MAEHFAVIQRDKGDLVVCSFKSVQATQMPKEQGVAKSLFTQTEKW